MKFEDLIAETETATVEIEITRTVLNQAANYFVSTDEADVRLLPFYADTIRNLLIATDERLFILQEKMQNNFESAFATYQSES